VALPHLLEAVQGDAPAGGRIAPAPARLESAARHLAIRASAARVDTHALCARRDSHAGPRFEPVRAAARAARDPPDADAAAGGAISSEARVLSSDVEASRDESREARGADPRGHEPLREEGPRRAEPRRDREHAGFTRDAFYVHFKDRDDFLVAVMDQVGSEYLKAVLATRARYFTPCINLLMSVERSSTTAPAPTSKPKLNVKPFVADSMVNPLSPLM
jgi:hypothetical protein